MNWLTENTRLHEKQGSLCKKRTRPGSCETRAHDPGHRERNCQVEMVHKLESADAKPWHGQWMLCQSFNQHMQSHLQNCKLLEHAEFEFEPFLDCDRGWQVERWVPVKVWVHDSTRGGLQVAVLLKKVTKFHTVPVGKPCSLFSLSCPRYIFFYCFCAAPTC